VIPRLGSRGQGWVVLQFVLLGAIGLAGLLTRGSWPEAVRTAAGVLGAVLLVAGVVVAVLALSGLGSALTAVPAPLEGERLRTGGIYSVVRHPIYGSLILMAAGFALLTSPWALLLTAVLAVELDLKRRVEEEFLSATYPGYAEYRRAVPHALLPGVW
jgi:protein-S-isoprenylcysteine O-methyltransferase Ste14